MYKPETWLPSRSFIFISSPLMRSLRTLQFSVKSLSIPKKCHKLMWKTYTEVLQGMNSFRSLTSSHLRTVQHVLPRAHQHWSVDNILSADWQHRNGRLLHCALWARAHVSSSHPGRACGSFNQLNKKLVVCAVALLARTQGTRCLQQNLLHLRSACR